MKKCVKCDEPFSPTKTNIVRCQVCRDRSRPKDRKCSDCDTLVGRNSARCKPCHNESLIGEGNPNYIGRSITGQGYVLLTGSDLRNHPNAQASGRILEHIKVMSDSLGRPLVNGEEVHHKNGNRSDNRVENLELWTRSHPTGVRVVDLYTWAQNYIRQYESEIDKIS